MPIALFHSIVLKSAISASGAIWPRSTPASSALAINSVTGFRGRINWNADMPDGAMMKVLDVNRMKQVLDGWSPPTTLHAGLDKTITWYRANKTQADAKW